ncbi:hypothetical protein L207DRAFT_517314 [Hyaloscypha variabilis F]|uniref:Uncharacterized protein n=1 Tax=Hyaloscypha variabilis (strain UAMH 11265 / GT02V1 / F) TaxID=1149755 RepID=A0A2J6R6C8_HYAVF|nr:hypothetical protein L207DRAFT_517314 [Hyaloscypha variabilis F]
MDLVTLFWPALHQRLQTGRCGLWKWKPEDASKSHGRQGSTTGAREHNVQGDGPPLGAESWVLVCRIGSACASRLPLLSRVVAGQRPADDVQIL